MKSIKFFNLSSSLILVVGVGFLLAGCGSDGPSLADDMKNQKGKPPPTAAEMAKGWQKIGEMHAKATQASSDWAKAHPDEAKKENADRAKLGLPPLGG